MPTYTDAPIIVVPAGAAVPKAKMRTWMTDTIDNLTVVESGVADLLTNFTTHVADVDTRFDTLEFGVDARLDGVDSALASRITVADLDEYEAVVTADLAEVERGNYRDALSRPGEDTNFFAGTIVAGEPDAWTPLSSALAATDDEGREVRLNTGFAYSRRAYAIEPTRKYKLRYAVQRRVDTADPSSDAVVVGYVPYTGEKNPLTAVPVHTYTTLTTGIGRQERTLYVSRTAGTVDGVAVTVLPVATRYLVPFVQVFTTTGTVAVQVISLTDITDAEISSVSVTEFDARLAALESGDLLDRVTDVETAIGSPSHRIFPTAQDAIAATIPVTVDVFSTLGYWTVGDNGDASYRRGSDAPGALQVGADFWEMIPSSGYVSPLQCGAKGDGTTDDTAAINETRAFAVANKLTLDFGARHYEISSTLTVSDDNERWLGRGGIIDPAPFHYDSDLTIALANVSTRLIWAGAAGGIMVKCDISQVSGDWRNHFGFSMTDMVLDGAGVAGRGLQSLSHCAHNHRNVAIARCTNTHWDMGVSANQLLTTCDSNSNQFINCWALTVGTGITGTRGWWFWGDRGTTTPRGNFCESTFIGGGSRLNLATGTDPNIEAEYSDSCKFYGFSWNGLFTLHSYDTGSRGLRDGVSSATASQCSNFNFFGYCGLVQVKASTGFPNNVEFGAKHHTYHGFPMENVNMLPIIEAGGDMLVETTGRPLVAGYGALRYGAGACMTQVWRDTNQSIPNNTNTAISWSHALTEIMESWVIGSATRITVPPNVKFARVFVSGTWDTSSTGERTIHLYKNGTKVRSDTRPGVAFTNFSVSFEPYSVKPADYLEIFVLQTSGGALNLLTNSNPAPIATVEWL